MKNYFYKSIKGKFIVVMSVLAIVLTVFTGNMLNVQASGLEENLYFDEMNLYGASNPYEAVFDAAFYANTYPDVKAAFGTNEGLLLQHFLQCGIVEGRQGCADFDPVTYMNRYPDLKAAYGNNMKLYYVHYLQIGKAEGRSGKPGVAPANAQAAVTAQQVSPANPYANAYDIMIGFKSSYPEGMRYTNEDFYKWNGGIYYGGYGCAGFAFMLSDAVFGKNPATMHYDMSKIRVGDILRIYNDTHSVIVLEVNDDGVVLAEANYNSSVHWGRKLSWTELSTSLDNVMTRY